MLAAQALFTLVAQCDLVIRGAADAQVHDAANKSATAATIVRCSFTAHPAARRHVRCTVRLARGLAAHGATDAHIRATLLWLLPPPAAVSHSAPSSDMRAAQCA